jgi:hypothetical protein
MRIDGGEVVEEPLPTSELVVRDLRDAGARAGLALSWGLVWYGCSRGAVDFLRAYDASSTLGEIHGYAIPISQVCSVLLVLVGAGIFGIHLDHLFIKSFGLLVSRLGMRRNGPGEDIFLVHYIETHSAPLSG